LKTRVIKNKLKREVQKILREEIFERECQKKTTKLKKVRGRKLKKL